MTTARENAFDNTVVPGAEYTKSAQFKEDFYNAGTPGEAKAQQGFFDRLSDRLINRKFAKFGADGKQAGDTSIFAELGWIATNFAAAIREIKGLLYSDVPWYGFDGKQPTTGRRTTNLALDVGYNDTRWAGNAADHKRQAEQIAALSNQVAELSALVKLIPKEGGK